MTSMLLSTIGIDMPMSFPIKPYEAVHSQIAKNKDNFLRSWNQYAGAWNAIAYRFLSCTDYNIKFIRSIKRFGNSPLPAERYKQEKCLFGFFVTGLSTVESFCYGLYAIASMINNRSFLIDKAEQLRKITVENTTKKFKCVYPKEKISVTLSKLREDPVFQKWKEIRNILTHRSAPGRHFFAGGDQNGEALWLDGIQINENTTSTRYEWLIDTLTRILNDTELFVSHIFC